ncbi:MAG: 3-dehydroquinate synthase [Pseudomonadota bacterium]
MSETVEVALPGREYRIDIGTGLLAEAGARLRPFLRRPQVFAVTEARVADAHLAAFEAGLAAAGVTAQVLTLPPGEATKSWADTGRVVEWLLERQAERSDLVVAFGGGVIGDLTGFAAAIVRRGVRFAQIPTTLLAQVDSSVGGKTGINVAAGKNLVGAFHQPVYVLADIETLASLPPRDFRSGYAEVAKYGLLGDTAFFSWLESAGPGIAAGDAALRAQAVATCCRMKADIVVRDEREMGERALLNLGHTFGHALEAATGYSNRLLHGEGVSIGIALAFALSERLGYVGSNEVARVRAHLRAMGLPVDLAEIPGTLPDADGLMTLMAQDKKVLDGQITFILARGIGEAFVARDVDPAVPRALLAEALGMDVPAL